MNDSGGAVPTAGSIAARIGRLLATRSIWIMLMLLGFGMFFELYDLLFTGYVAPSLVKSGVLTAKTEAAEAIEGTTRLVAAVERTLSDTRPHFPALPLPFLIPTGLSDIAE